MFYLYKSEDRKPVTLIGNLDRQLAFKAYVCMCVS